MMAAMHWKPLGQLTHEHIQAGPIVLIIGESGDCIATRITISSIVH